MINMNANILLMTAGRPFNDSAESKQKTRHQM